MKKLIILAIFALLTIGAACGKRELRVNLANQGVVKLVDVDDKDRNQFSVLYEWKVENDTVTIESESPINLGRIRHDSGKDIINFVVSENGKNNLINEKSKNITDSILTIKPDSIYDFYKVKDKFLTILVVRPKPLVYDVNFISADKLAFCGDTMTVIGDSLFVYKVRSDTLIYISSWPTDYHLTLKGQDLNPSKEWRLCGGDSITIIKGEKKYVLAVERDVLTPPVETGIWFWGMLALVLLFLIWIIVVIIRNRRLQRNIHMMNGDLEKAADGLNQVNAKIQKSVTESKQEVKQPDIVQQDNTGTEDATKEEGKKEKKVSQKFYWAFKSIIEILKIFRRPKCYTSMEFSVTEIINGIDKLNKGKTEIESSLNEQINQKTEQISKISSLINENNKTKIEELSKELGEIGANICALKDTVRCYDEILRRLKVKDNDAALSEIQHLQDLNSHSENESNANSDGGKDVGNASAATDNGANGTINNDTKWENVKQLLEKKKKYTGGALEVTVLRLLEKFLDANYFRNMLHDSRDKEKQDVINRYILDTLGRREKALFPDAEGNSKDWVVYIKEKCEATKDVSTEQKDTIIHEAILEAVMHDTSKSKVLKGFVEQLLGLLRHKSDKEALSQNNARLQTIADILNNTPRNSDEAKNKGAEEVLVQLQSILKTENVISIDDIGTAVESYFDSQVKTNVDAILKRKEYSDKVEAKEQEAKNIGREETRNLLQDNLADITQEIGADVRKLKSINSNGDMAKAIKNAFDIWLKTKNQDSLTKDKENLLKNPALEEAYADIESYVTVTPIINKLAKMVEEAKGDAQHWKEEHNQRKGELDEQEKEHEAALKKAAEEKKKALDAQEEKLNAKIQEEKDGREEDNRRWSQTNAANIATIKEYHLTELNRIKTAFSTIDEQLKIAYTNFDRNTPIGKLIDKFIKKNTFYSLDKFIEKIGGIGCNSTETAQELSDSLKALYSECLTLTPPNWIDVLSRLYCYVNEPFIAEAFGKAGLDCQAIRQAFFQMQQLLSNAGITLSYPRLFKDKVTDGNYEVKPERNIDNYVSGLADHIADRQTIIDLYTVGFQISGEAPRKPVISTF